MIGRENLTWKGLELYFQGGKMAEVVQDDVYPKMYRVKRLDGSLSDMVNLSRAKDAALGGVIATLNADIRGRAAR